MAVSAIGIPLGHGKIATAEEFQLMVSAETLPLRNLLDAAPDGFIVVDVNGAIIWANRTAHEMFGYRDVELIGRQVEELIPQRLHVRHTAHRAAYDENPHGRSMGLGLNLLASKRDGSEFPVEISLSPLHTRDGLLVTAVVRDVSERKRLEDERNTLTLELETNRERDRIAMDLHDGIMQDIYAVALGLELSLEAAADGKADAGGVEKAINQLHGVIRSIRSFIFDLRPREFSGTLADALVSLTDEFAQNSQIPATAAIDRSREPEPAVAMAAYHIAHESLSNIRKHARASNVQVCLSFYDGCGRLEIRDDGSGFDSAEDPPEGHYGMRNMTTRAGAIKGRLRIESAVNRGTAVILDFPLAGQD